MSEGADRLGATLSATNIFRVQVADALNRVGQSLGIIAVDFAIARVQASGLLLEPVALSDRVSHRVLGREGVHSAGALPVLLVDVVVAMGVVVLLARVGDAVAGAGDVLHADRVAHGSLGVHLGLGSLDVVDVDLIANELGGFGLHVIEGLELILRVQRV